MRLDQVVEQDGLVPCDPGMISFIATEVMLSGIAHPWSFESLGKSKIANEICLRHEINWILAQVLVWQNVRGKYWR